MNLFLNVALLLPCCIYIHGETKFKSIPTIVKTYENDTVLLPCYVENKNIVESINWYKDGMLIASSSQISLMPPDRVRMWTNGSLEVTDLNDSDTGEYECRVINSDSDTIISQLHAIEVLYPPSVVTEPEVNELTFNLNEDIELSCKAEGVPKPIITWYYNDKEIELLDDRPKLKFTATKKSLSGIYECRATNGVGEPAVGMFNIVITYPPDLSTNKSWVHSSPGLRAGLECNVQANPPAKVTWLKNDAPLRTSPRIHQMTVREKHLLTIRHVHPSDFGNYTCRAENELGDSELYIQLSGAPNAAVFKKSEFRTEGDSRSHTVIWEVDSYSTINEYNLWFRPYRKGNTATYPAWTKLVIPGEYSTGPLHSKSYTLTGLEEKTIYEAVLVSRNRYGWSKPSMIAIFGTEGADFSNDIKEELETRIENNIIPVEVATISTSSTASLFQFDIFVTFSIVLLIIMNNFK